MTPEEARQVLGLPNSHSTAADIDRAFRCSAKRQHPDVQRDALARHDAQERFRRLLEARRTLRAVAATPPPPPSSAAPSPRAKVPSAPRRGHRGPKSVDRSLVGYGGWIIAGWAAVVLFSPWWLLLPVGVTLAWARRRRAWTRLGLQVAATEVGRAMAVAGVAAAVAITLANVL